MYARTADIGTNTYQLIRVDAHYISSDAFAAWRVNIAHMWVSSRNTDI